MFVNVYEICESVIMLNSGIFGMSYITNFTHFISTILIFAFGSSLNFELCELLIFARRELVASSIRMIFMPKYITQFPFLFRNFSNSQLLQSFSTIHKHLNFVIVGIVGIPLGKTEKNWFSIRFGELKVSI